MRISGLCRPSQRSCRLIQRTAYCVGFSLCVTSGWQVYQDVIEELYNRVNDRFGTSVPVPGADPARATCQALERRQVYDSRVWGLGSGHDVFLL